MTEGFHIVYGIVGKVEFETYPEALEWCRKMNGAAIYDAECDELSVNSNYRPVYEAEARQKVEGEGGMRIFLALCFGVWAGIMTLFGCKTAACYSAIPSAFAAFTAAYVVLGRWGIQ